MKINRCLGITALVLLISELVLFLLSWILSATMTEGVRSLLSSEGIRWFFGSFTYVLASPLLVWLILALIALGCLQKSGLLSMHQTYREKVALRVALAFLIFYIVIILLLTAFPHAILLSATGALFPSAFSHSLVPVIAFGIVVFSIIFGLMSGRISTLAEIMTVLSFGIQKGAPLFIVYILLIQLNESLWFVFGGF